MKGFVSLPRAQVITLLRNFLLEVFSLISVRFGLLGFVSVINLLTLIRSEV